jgi:hypothetical protein
MLSQDKFLVKFIESLSQKQLFFLIWSLIVGGFIFAMISHLRRTTRRNFRSPAEGTGPKITVDVRRLQDSKGKGVVVKEKKES